MTAFDAVIGIVVLLVISVAFGGFWLIRHLNADRPRPAFRDIPAFTRLPLDMGNAIERGRRLHVGLGSSTVYAENSAAALVGLHALDVLADTAIISDRPAQSTAGDASLALLAQDTLRKVYRRQNALDLYGHNEADWLGATPFSYAAATTALYREADVAANLMIGQYGIELALMTDAGARVDAQQVVATSDVTMQALAYLTGDEPIIGEDVFAVGAYLGDGDDAHIASLQAQDVARLVLFVLLLVGGALGLVSRLAVGG